MEPIKCRFCGKEVSYPSGIDETNQCPGCGAYYETTTEGDEGLTLYDLAELVTGEFVWDMEKVEEALEYEMERKFDFLYEDEEEARVAPEMGIEVALIWARPREESG